MIRIGNKHIAAEIHQHGAELHSVTGVANNIQYLWNGDEKVWGRHAPHLFPIVGGLKNGALRFKGKEYKMPRHGFARDREFTLIEKSETAAEFELCADERSLAVFPFHFSLRVRYSLDENHLSCRYIVFNPSNDLLYYSLGAHPGFLLNLGGCTGIENYFLEFDKDESALRYFVKDGLISEQTESFNTVARRFALDKKMFDADALVMKSLQSNHVSLLNTKNDHGVKLGWDRRFSYFGIWSVPAQEQFVCLEPWSGIADAFDFGGNFEEKEGVRKLLPFESETFNLVYTFF